MPHHDHPRDAHLAAPTPTRDIERLILGLQRAAQSLADDARAADEDVMDNPPPSRRASDARDTDAPSS